MWGHFRHRVVFIAYLSAIVSIAFFTWLPPEEWIAATVVMSVALVVVDYRVHQSIHRREWLPAPVASVAWVFVLTVALSMGFVASGWQVAGIYVTQAFWDNSWHAMQNHHEDCELRADLDHPVVRWGAATLAGLFVAAPWILSRVFLALVLDY